MAFHSRCSPTPLEQSTIMSRRQTSWLVTHCWEGTTCETPKNRICIMIQLFCLFFCAVIVGRKWWCWWCGRSLSLLSFLSVLCFLLLSSPTYNCSEYTDCARLALLLPTSVSFFLFLLFKFPRLKFDTRRAVPKSANLTTWDGKLICK